MRAFQLARVRVCRRLAPFSTAPGTAMPIPSIVVQKFGPPEVMEMGQKELPKLGPGQVRLKIGAAGVNPSDTYMRLGPYGPWSAVPHLLPKPPFTPGKDGAGVIEELGEGVTNVNVGQRVYLAGCISGTYAAEAICDASSVHPLPEGISFSQGACVGVPCATAYHALHFRARVAPGQRVLVHGASGAVGLAAVQLAKDIGCHVIGTAGTSAGEDAVRAAGADGVANHKTEDYKQKLQEFCPEGYDVILEMAAHVNLPVDLTLAATRSCVCIIGSQAKDVGVNPRATMAKEVDVRGVFLGTQTPEERAQTHAGLQAAMAKGVLRPVVGMELPLLEAPKAHVEVMGPSSGGAIGNIVLIPSSL